MLRIIAFFFLGSDYSQGVKDLFEECCSPNDSRKSEHGSSNSDHKNRDKVEKNNGEDESKRSNNSTQSDGLYQRLVIQ
jgi:hypothetical protein